MEEEVEAFHSLYERLSLYLVETEAYDRVSTLEIVNEEFTDQEEEEEEIRLAPAALDDTPPKVRDPTEKVNLGTTDEPIEVAISTYLEPSEKQRLVELLLEFKDCFVEKYEDMPGLSPDLVCHQLPTLPDKRPVKQEPRRMNSETQVLVKKEVEKMYKSGIIRVAKYNKWLSNIVPVRKKNGKMRICRDITRFLSRKKIDTRPHSAALEVYIDDVVVKSKKSGDHFTDLRKIFERMQLHKLKMNPAKCVFGVQVGDFLGFIVHQRGIEVPEDKANAVINASPPRTKKELQRLLGRINFLRRFISNSSGKIHPFSPLLKLQGQNEFVWEPKHQEAFDKIKAYLASPPVLVPPRTGFPLKLYVSAAEASIGSLLAQDDANGVEHAIFYLICATESNKGQAIADFLAHHPMLDVPAVRDLEVAATTLDHSDLACLPEYAALYQATVSLQPWVLYFDGSRTDTLAGAGVVLENPTGDRFSYSFQLEFQCTNNQAEYEDLIIGLEVLLEMGIGDVQILGDSLLVINQLCNEFRCNSFTLVPYWNRALDLLDQFDNIHLEHIPRERNFAANKLAQLATGVTLRYGVRERILKVERRTLPSWMARRDPPDDTSVATLEPIDVDWRIPLIAYLKQPDPTADRKIRFLALNYFLRGNELRRRGEDGIDFRCVYGCEAKQLMREVHSGICGAHQAGPKMRWLLRRHGYFWPSILKDCIAFAKGCLDCQAHGPVQHHKFIIVATDFFTKWVEAEPLKEASGGALRQFLFRNIICRFGIPEVFVSDRGAAFMGGEVDKLAKEWGIQFIHSSPYYAQSNGQAEASNKIIITLLKKMLEANPRQWHETLYETLWPTAH
ncbi:uncharacterized protein LOC112177605 [Rosa chinensis]|uniref:uncharacterized protein LOC112177605 n=1 Tax=Rosa chinensis TaxID=74649 RepID=UPI001AD8FF23|nr:uncharacterized protein LOC112177605 [Rosa chinensis]